jgi:hypothetical protein
MEGINGFFDDDGNPINALVVDLKLQVAEATFQKYIRSASVKFY